MKKFKKLMALVIAMVMVFSLSLTVYATGTEGGTEGSGTEGGTEGSGTEGSGTTDTYKISVKTDNDKVEHTYKIYQIFTGKPDNGKLTDVQYGSSYPGGKTGSVPKTELDAITDARAWAKTNKNNLGAEVATLNNTTTSYDDAVPGWYLVLDTAYTPTDATADAYSAFMVAVVDKDTEFTPKKEVPSVNKEVSDNADPAGSTADKIAADGTKTNSNAADFYETADHKFGETFQFRLTATIPAGDYTAYDTYKAIFHDTMSTGITFESIASVKVGGADYTGYTLAGVNEKEKGPKTWTITFANLEQVAKTKLVSDLVIEVVYNAHLNPDAATNTATGSTTNENKVKLEYSNNPDLTGTGTTDETPEDYVWVFAYESDNKKVDKNGEPVAGAEFQLKDSTGAVISLYKVGTVYSVYDAAKATEYTGGTVVDHVTTDGTTGKFDFKGLDAGTYTLTESKVPDGYVKCADITITIGAATEEVDATTNNVTLTSTNQHNDVINLTGTTLPSTGGIGTTLFYIVGAVLVIGAGVLLVTRRRMSAQ